MDCYDSYKDSGVEWIGEIPDDWDCRPISTLYDSRNEKVSERDFPALSVTMQGIVPQLETAAKSNDTENRKLVKKGDFAINSRSDRRGSCGISEYDGSVSLITNVLKPKSTSGMENRYYSYLFSSEHFSDEYYRNGTGIVDDLWSTNWSRMKRIYVPVPSYSFQVKIAKYLDEKTSQIDSLIEENEKSIELLEEYRKSIISEAVTKGLDPNAPMKDSGVEWIGEIPEGWHVARFKQVVSLLDVSTSEKPDNVIMLEDIESWTGKLISTSDPNNYKNGGKCFQKNDVLFSKLRPYLAKAVYAPFSGVCSGEMLVLRSSSIDHKFLQYHLLSHNFIDEINAATYGAKMPRASWGIVGETQIAFPGLKKQKQIVSCLNEKTAQIDSLIDKKKQLIEKLTQYRKSLIYECVTGKIKVPGVE